MPGKTKAKLTQKKKNLVMKKKIWKKKERSHPPDVSPLICSLTDFQNKLGLR
jgi:hypothetical protein